MAAPQNDIAPYLAEFGNGGQTPEDSARLRLPSHRDLRPPLPDDGLHPVTEPAIDRHSDEMLDKRRFMEAKYKGRIEHPVLDAVEEDRRWESWEHCHNGLYHARQGQYLHAPEIFHLAERLITWAQEDPAARLGPRSKEKCNWFILPEHYTLLVRPQLDSHAEEDEETEKEDEATEKAFPLGESGLYTDQEKSHHETAFDKAKFTIHFVHFKWPEHWAVIIYRLKTGDSWFIDSLYRRYKTRDNDEEEKAYRDRSEGARKALTTWLKESNRPIPEGGQHHCVASTYQVDFWSCGLHAIANAMAFIRFEVLRWNNIPDWKGKGPKVMRKQLLTTLHNIMGLKIDPAHKSPLSATKRARGAASETESAGRPGSTASHSSVSPTEQRRMAKAAKKGEPASGKPGAERQSKPESQQTTPEQRSSEGAQRPKGRRVTFQAESLATPPRPPARKQDARTKAKPAQQASFGARKPALGRSLREKMDKKNQRPRDARLADLREEAREISEDLADALAQPAAGQAPASPTSMAAAALLAACGDDTDDDDKKKSAKKGKSRSKSAATAGAADAATKKKSSGEAGAADRYPKRKRKADDEDDGAADATALKEEKRARARKRKKGNDDDGAAGATTKKGEKQQGISRKRKKGDDDDSTTQKEEKQQGRTRKRKKGDDEDGAAEATRLKAEKQQGRSRKRKKTDDDDGDAARASTLKEKKQHGRAPKRKKADDDGNAAGTGKITTAKKTKSPPQQKKKPKGKG